MNGDKALKIYTFKPKNDYIEAASPKGLIPKPLAHPKTLKIFGFILFRMNSSNSIPKGLS
jgi:hypothetical protein